MAGKIHWLFHVNSPLTYFYPSLNKVFMCCQKNSIMSVFCSNTLISAPECWKYILRAQFSNFSQELHFQCSQIASLPHIFFFSAYSKAFATYIILLKPCTGHQRLQFWSLRLIEYCILLKKLKANQCNVCPPNNSLSWFYIEGWTMIFF